MLCILQVTIRLWNMPTYLAPTSLQAKSQFLRPIGITLRAHSRSFVSIGISESVRSQNKGRRYLSPPSPARSSRCAFYLFDYFYLDAFVEKQLLIIAVRISHGASYK